MSILVALLLEISDELSDTSRLSVPQCRRLTMATANLVKSLFVVIAPNQLRILLSTCLMAFSDTKSEAYLKLKLLTIDLTANVDHSIAFNAPYTADGPSSLLVSGNSDDHDSRTLPSS